jgi:hypothetical protein
VSNTWKSDHFYVWLRVDKDTRKMCGTTWLNSFEEALSWAEQQFGDRPFEIDNGGRTVYVSELSKVILNGGQFGLFGS